MLDSAVDPGICLHIMLVKPDTRRRIIAWTRARTCYAEQKQLPSHEESQKPSQVRLRRRADINVLELPCGWTTNACGRAEVSLQNLEHDERDDVADSGQKAGLD